MEKVVNETQIEVKDLANYNVSEELKDLIVKLLNKDVQGQLKISTVLKHSWLNPGFAFVYQNRIKTS